MGTDWILFALLSLLWLAAGGVPFSALKAYTKQKSEAAKAEGEAAHRG